MAVLSPSGSEVDSAATHLEFLVEEPSMERFLRVAAEAANLPTRSRAASGLWRIANRIVIEELEAWYFGDWEAVRQAYPRVSAKIPRRARFRDPDAIKGGTWEAFERVMKKHGYFTTGLRKVEAAESIAAHINPDRNKSRSFSVFRRVLVEAIAP